MGQKHIHSNLHRRMLTDNGWIYFCRVCGKFLPEENFYKQPRGRFGLNSKCKLHFGNQKTEPVDKEMEYLKLGPIQDEDFQGVQEFLGKLGYEFGPNADPIYKQFEQKHNINGQTENEQEKGDVGKTPKKK